MRIFKIHFGTVVAGKKAISFQKGGNQSRGDFYAQEFHYHARLGSGSAGGGYTTDSIAKSTIKPKKVESAEKTAPTKKKGKKHRMRVLVPKDCAALNKLKTMKHSNARTIYDWYYDLSYGDIFFGYDLDYSTETCVQAAEYCKDEVYADGTDCTECSEGMNSQGIGSVEGVEDDDDGDEISDECQAECEAEITQCMAEEGYTSADYAYSDDGGIECY